MLSIAAALDRLALPYASEEFSPLTGAGLLVVDLDSEPRATGEASILSLREALAGLPCPSLALCRHRPGPLAARLLDAFDVHVRDAAELEGLRASILRNPLASLALVQLLRSSTARSIEEGLIAESLVYSTLQSGPEFAAWRKRRAPPGARRSGLAPAVRSQRRGDTLHLTLNRPERHNAFSAEMRDALTEGLQLAVSDPSILEVVLAGAGDSFCSGGDLDEFGTLPDPATAHAIRSTRNPARLLARCAERTRCELHGACIGAGIELPAFSVRIIARPDTFFQLPELGMGLVPGAGGTVSLPRRIGRQRTALLALTGDRLDVATALDWGLIDGIEERPGSLLGASA